MEPQLTPVAGQTYGTDLSCHQCDLDGSSGYYRERPEPTHWWLGLDSKGQAHYACTNCATGLFAVRPLRD